MGLNDGDSAVPAVNYGVIRSWINYWQKDLLEEPKEVLLGSEHLGNVVPEARSALEKWLQQRRKKNVQKNSKGDWELTLVRILGLLERAIKEDPVADLVALEYPNEMNDLRSLLSVKQIYEVGCIYPILQRIEGAPSLRTLKEVLLRELSKGERADQRLMGAVAVELARTGVGKFDSRELRGLLKSALADEGTALLLKEHLESIKADTRLEDQARGLWQEFLFKAANSEKVAEGTGADGGVLFDMFGGDLTWRSLTYWLLNDLRVLWVSALEQCRTSMDDGAFGASALVSMLKADEEALTQLGTKIVRRYAVNVFRQTFHYVRKEANEKPSASMEEAGRTFAEFVGKRGVFHDPKSPGEYQGVLRAASRTALQAAAIATELELSAVCADRYVAEDSGFVSGVASGIGYRMMEMLEDEVSSFKKTDSEGPTGKDTEVDGCSYEELESICSNWAARRSVHNDLGFLLAPLNARLRNYMQHAADPSHKRELPLSMGFWESWARFFSKRPTDPAYVPWQAINHARLERVLDGLFARLKSPEAEQLVVFKVRHLKAQGLRWPVGKATFYDPEHFDHGEGLVFRDSGSNDSFSHASVMVFAETKASARRRSRRLLEDALICLSFATSVHQNSAGVKLEVIPEYFILNLSATISSFRAAPSRASWPEYGAADQGLPQLSSAFDSLLNLAADKPHKLTELQEGFLKAVNWYREAHWEEDPAKRFALYWIALEHLFVKGRKKETISDEVSRLYVTWRNLRRALLPVSWSNREVEKKIEEDEDLRALVDSDMELKSWRSNAYILLDPKNIERLIELTPHDMADAKKLFKDYTKQLVEVASRSKDIDEDVRRRRDSQWFKLYMLYNLRNAMFHEAIHDDARLNFFAEEIGMIADDVLYKVASEAVSETSECTTIGELMEKLERQPWDASA